MKKIPTSKSIVSHFATYRAVDRKTLIGAVKSSQTCRYSDLETLKGRCEQIAGLHSGRKLLFTVHTSNQAPELFVHCGKTTTAVFCRCTSCGKHLTWQDAIEAGKRDNGEKDELPRRT